MNRGGKSRTEFYLGDGFVHLAPLKSEPILVEAYEEKPDV